MNTIAVPTRRTRRLRIAVGVAIALAGTGVSAANAGPSQSGVAASTSRQVRFAGVIFATESGENIDIVGQLHLVTQLSGSERTGWTIEWHTNLDNTTGTGRSTGDVYRGTGADRGAVAMPPGPPVREAFLEPSFTLRPPGDSVHPPSPCRLAVHVVYDDAGNVSTVEVHVAEPQTGSVD